MTPSEQYAWFYYGNGKKYMKEVYDKFGVYNYPGGNTGNQMGGWFRKEIKTTADLKGLKMRIPGLAGEVLAKLGVNVTNIPAGELYTSLDRGTIDALEWVGPGMDIKMGFHKVAPFYYTGWHEPASEMQFMVNKKAFDKLPDNFKAILEVAMKAAAFDMYVENFSASLEAWAKIKKDFPNIKVKTFPKAVVADMQKAATDVYEGYAAKNPKFKEIYEDYTAYMKKARAWSQMMQGGYLNLQK
jgi:TRAP-type mannitol/chloroaromatic compound transport system substrate-binding protein